MPSSRYRMALSLYQILSYAANVTGQPAYPESYSLGLSPNLTYFFRVTGQAVYPESYSLTLSPNRSAGIP